MEVMLKDVRIAFISSLVGDAEDYQGNGVFRHSATFLVEPGSANDKAVQDAIKKAAAQVYEKKAEAILEDLRGNSNKYCYLKGDRKDYEGFQGMMALSGHRAKKDGRPLLLDSVKDPETGKAALLFDPKTDNWAPGKAGRLYAGCFVNAKVEIYAQAGKNVGIRCSLIGIQYHRDGDSFGGAKRGNADDFDSIEAPEEDDLA